MNEGNPMKHMNKNKLRSSGARITGPLRKKGAGEDELADVIDRIGKGFEDYKSTNDAAIEELKKKGNTDPLTADKLKKIDEELTSLESLKKELENLKGAVDKVSVKANRPRGGSEESVEQLEHRKAFGRFLRKGDIDNLSKLQEKALNITTDGDGGYAVPEMVDSEIADLLVEVSPVRSVARTITVGTSDYKKLVNIHGTASGWVDEDDARPETGTPGLQAVVPPIGEIYANPAATQTMLDDVFFNAESWLAEEVQTEFAKQEGVAFISGDGLKKPKGFLSYASVVTADAGRAFGTLQHVVSGAAADFAAADPGDVLIDLFYSLKAGHRQNSSWMMNSQTTGRVRKFKDGDGNYLWQPGLGEGLVPTLLGRPLVTAEDMPAIAADSLPIALGNWQAGYYVVDRFGTRVLRDPFTNKPYVQFYTTKRVGGGVVDSEAIKLIKISV